jgi:hypothetical protein
MAVLLNKSTPHNTLYHQTTMNWKLFFPLILLLGCFGLCPLYAQLYVTSPSGGEKLPWGSRFEIRWQSMDIQGTVDISLWNAKNNQFIPIASGVKVSDGKFNWSVPFFTPNPWYRIKIQSNQSSSYAFSPTFFSLVRNDDAGGNGGGYVIDPNTSVSVIPNPVSGGKVTFIWSDKTPILMVKILDVSGNVIESLAPGNIWLQEVSYMISPDLPSGLYPIQYIFTDGSAKYSKMMIVR